MNYSNDTEGWMRRKRDWGTYIAMAVEALSGHVRNRGVARSSSSCSLALYDTMI